MKPSQNMASITSSNLALPPTGMIWMRSSAMRWVWRIHYLMQSAFAKSIILSPPSFPRYSYSTLLILQYFYSNLGLGHGPFFECTLTEPEETDITMIYCSNHDHLFPLFQSGEWVGFSLGGWFGGWWTEDGVGEALEKGQSRLRRRGCRSSCIGGCRSFDGFSVISLALWTRKGWREFGKSIEESGEFM